MFVMPIKALFSLSQFNPHQTLLSSNSIEQFSESKHGGRVIFVTHQWAAHSSPDPSNIQLSTLQSVLRRMMGGFIDKIETNWVQALVFKDSPSISRKQMEAAVPHMFVWIDFMSMPQPTCGISLPAPMGPPAAQGKLAQSVNMLSESAQLKFNSPSIEDQLLAAVESIPAYVEHSSLMISLVPPTTHLDRQGELVSWQSWRRRGWCRMEFASANLSREELPIMVVHGPLSQPEFVLPVDAMSLAPGLGDFTCCACGHDFGGGEGTSPCDKIKIATVVDHMLEAKIDHLFSSGRMFEARYYTCLSKFICRGLEDQMEIVRKAKRFVLGGGVEEEEELGEQDEGAPEASPLWRLEQRLRFRSPSIEKEFFKSTGTSLVFWAALDDNSEALTELLAPPNSANPSLSIGLTNAWPALTLFKYMTPLHAAVAFSGWRTVEVLLDGGAPPAALTDSSTGFTPLLLACMAGRADLIKRWLQRSPSTDLEFRDKVSSQTALLFAAFAGFGNAKETTQTLIEAGAKTDALSGFGANIFTEAAMNPDADQNLIEYLKANVKESGRLLSAQADNMNMFWTCVYKAAQVARWCGTSQVLLQTFAAAYKATPLHNACGMGQVDNVQNLLESGADPEAKNEDGWRPLELARLFYNGGMGKGKAERRRLAKEGEVPEALLAMFTKHQESS